MDTVQTGWQRAVRLARLGVLALAAAGAFGTALANPSGELRVSAVVRKIARLQVLAQPQFVRVTEGDVARGYVEVIAPVQVAVRSNTRDGYMLAFDPRADFFRQAHVRGLDVPLQVGPAGGVIAQRASASPARETVLALGFRFELAPSAREGVYPWPFQLSAEPL
jgi:hypothetical protein